MKQKYSWLLGFILIMFSNFSGFGQIEKLTQKDLKGIEEAAMICLEDYKRSMDDLVNPSTNELNLQDYLTESKNFFWDSARVEIDYMPEFAPPIYNSEDKDKYLEQFYRFYHKYDMKDRVKVYFFNQKPSEVYWSEQGKYYGISITYSSQYGNSVPQMRVASFRADKINGKWKALITYIRFESSPGHNPFETTWKSLALQAQDSLKHQKLEQAFALLQKSIALDSTAFNLSLLAKYYSQKDSLDQALAYYEKSLKKSSQTDTSVQVNETKQKIQQLREKIQQRIIAKKKADQLHAYHLTLQAEQLLNNKLLDAAYDSLQRSLALDTTEYNLRLMGQYYHMQEEIDKSITFYEMSERRGMASDPSYMNEETRLALKKLYKEREKQKKKEEKTLVENKKESTLDEGTIAGSPEKAEMKSTSSDTARLQENATVITKEEDKAEPASVNAINSIINLNNLAKGGKWGKEYNISWDLPENHLLTISLLSTVGGKARVLQSNYTPDQLPVKIDKKIKPGRYTISLMDEQRHTVLTNSEPFRISRRFPLGLKITLYAGAAYVAVAALNPLLTGDKADQEQKYKINWTWIREWNPPPPSPEVLPKPPSMDKN